MPPDPRCYLAGWLLDHGDEDAGRLLAAQIQAERPDDADVYEFVGEAFESIDDLAEATRWFTTGALRLLSDEDSGLGYDEARLLQGRRRVRLAQGFTEDDYDRLVAPSE